MMFDFTSSLRPLSNADVARFVLLLFLVASLKPLSHGLSFASLNELVSQLNIVFIWALGVAYWRFGLAQVKMPLSASGIGASLSAVVLFAVSSFFGIEQISGLALSLVAIFLFCAPNKTQDFKSGLLLTVALAINSFWAPLIFQTFTAAIIAIDTTVLSWVYKVLRPDIILTGTTFQTDKFGIVVVGVCSVFASASMAVLAVAAATQYFRPHVGKRDFVVLFASMVVMLGLNTLRLAMTGWSREQFAFWHNGAGVAVFGNFQLLIIAAIAFFGAKWASDAKLK